jgi:signal transduction histidine kinase
LFLVKNNEGRIYTADASGNLFYIQENKLKFLEQKRLATDSGNNFISISVSDLLYKTGLDFQKVIYTLQFDKTLSIGDTATFVTHSGSLMYFSQTVTSPKFILDKIDIGFKLDGQIFLTNNQKDVFKFDQALQQMSKNDIFENDKILTEDKKQSIYIWENGMESPLLFIKNKAWTIAYKGGKLTAALICNTVPEDELIKYAQYDEKRKILFIGTDSKGVIVIEKKRIRSLQIAGTKSSLRTSYYSQFELPDGNIVTNEGHILGENISNTKSSPVKGKFSTNILLWGDSVLFYAQPDARLNVSYLHSYNFKTGVTKFFPNIREGYQFLMASAGNDIYIDRDSGIFRLKADTVEMIHAYPPGKGIHYDMKEIAPGILGIASCNLLMRLDINSKKLDTVFSTDNYCVRTIWQYKDYTFLGSYGGGLFIYKNGIVKQLPLDKNKYLLFTHCFVKDDEGFCWISTNRGLFKASITELTDVFDKNSKEVYYYYYGKNDGMDMTELNGGCTPCALLKKDKTISFPTMDGLLWVDPQRAQSILPAGEIYIDDVSVDGKFTDPDSLALKELPAKTSEIIIRLGISAWTNKENINIWYKINNDSLWKSINIEKGAEIRFNNLPQGKYNLQIKKRNGFGENNYSYKNFEFYITVPWYESWWFYLIMTLLLLGAILLYTNLRTRQLRKNQQRLEKLIAEKTKELQGKNEVLEKNDSIKTRLISIISHDIVTPLKFLTAAGKNLIEKKSQMPEALQDETIKEMANTSQELQLLSTNILNWIKYQNENRRLTREYFNVHDLAEQVIGILKTLAKQKQNELVNNIDKDLFIQEYFEPLRIIIYNLVSNAINFTEQGKIFVGSTIEDHKTVIQVTDEGVGMTAEQIQNVMANQFIISSVNVDNRKGNGLGYLIIKDLLKMMGSKINIQSEKGKGTTVSIILTGNQKLSDQ